MVPWLKFVAPRYQWVSASSGAEHTCSCVFATLCSPASTRRFPTNQIPTIRFRALLNEEASEVELVLRVAGKEDKA